MSRLSTSKIADIKGAASKARPIARPWRTLAGYYRFIMTRGLLLLGRGEAR